MNWRDRRGRGTTVSLTGWRLSRRSRGFAPRSRKGSASWWSATRNWRSTSRRFDRTISWAAGTFSSPSSRRRRPSSPCRPGRTPRRLTRRLPLPAPRPSRRRLTTRCCRGFGSGSSHPLWASLRTTLREADRHNLRADPTSGSPRTTGGTAWSSSTRRRGPSGCCSRGAFSGGTITCSNTCSGSDARHSRWTTRGSR